MADDIGEEGIKEFESMMKEFQSWCNKKRSEKQIDEYSSDDNFSCVKKKRKHVPMTSDRYTSNVKRVFNTDHM